GELRLLDASYCCFHADHLEDTRKGKRNRLDGRTSQHDLELQGLTSLGIDHLGAFQLVTGLPQHADRNLEVLTQFLRGSVDRVLVGLRKDLGRHQVFYVVEDLEFQTLRKAGRSKLGTEEEAVYPIVGIVEDRSPEFFEIKCVV